MINKQIGYKIIELKDKIVPNFTKSHWQELGMIIGLSDVMIKHNRLLRNLSFGDGDYEGNVIEVLKQFEERYSGILVEVKKHIHSKFSNTNIVNISSMPQAKSIVFTPSVFKISEKKVDENLISVIMRFSKAYDDVYSHIKFACSNLKLEYKRADDISEDHTIIQDKSSLIYKSMVYFTVMADYYSYIIITLKKNNALDLR